MTTVIPRSIPAVRVDVTSPRDIDAFCHLLSLATPGEPLPPAVAEAPRLKIGPPLSHGRVLCLSARNNTSQPIGALIASTPRWIFEHSRLTGTPLPFILQHRVISIHAVAVHPDHRHRGIARKLIRSAERRARDAGYLVTLLEHPAKLTDFYTRLGYHAGSDQHVVSMPQRLLLAQDSTGLCAAAKPLTNQTNVTVVPGFPSGIICGLLPGTNMPSTVRYRNGQLTY